jgi:hypothetical protein
MGVGDWGIRDWGKTARSFSDRMSFLNAQSLIPHPYFFIPARSRLNSSGVNSNM